MADGRPIPWREILQWALVGTMVITSWVFLDAKRYGNNPLTFIQPGARGPSVTAFHEDFPESGLPAGVGLDGQQFYVMARNPTHMREVAPLLDRPHYRLQRPLLAWLAWALHPSGGGTGLIWAFLAVGLAATLAGSVATGALAVSLGGRPWLAMAFALTPGAWWSLRVSVADALALALALGAVALSQRGRWRTAIALGVAAVLAKEVILVVFAGWLIGHRNRRAALLVAIPAAVAIGWWSALRAMLPPGHEAVGELVAPFVGWVDAVRTRWLHGQELVGMTATVVSVVLAIAALAWRRQQHPLAWPLLISLAFAALANGDVIGNNYGSTRALMPVLVLAVVALFTPVQGVRTDTSPPQGAGGIVGPAAASGGASNR